MRQTRTFCEDILDILIYKRKLFSRKKRRKKQEETGSTNDITENDPVAIAEFTSINSGEEIRQDNFK